MIPFSSLLRPLVAAPFKSDLDIETYVSVVCSAVMRWENFKSEREYSANTHGIVARHDDLVHF